MIMTLIFCISFMITVTSVFQMIALGVFGHLITLPHIGIFDISNPFISYPSVVYQIYFWFEFAGIL